MKVFSSSGHTTELFVFREHDIPMRAAFPTHAILFDLLFEENEKTPNNEATRCVIFAVNFVIIRLPVLYYRV